jgi:hypothetical protein
MPRQRIGAEPMSPAERQARHRAKQREQSQTSSTPAALAPPKGTRGRRLARPLSRTERWATAVATLLAVQEEYRGWLDNLPANLEGSRLADKLQAICELDLEELQAIDLPRGYGRD